MSPTNPPTVLIMGACGTVGSACGRALAGRGAGLLLADIDSEALGVLADELGAVSRYCDVASEASVTVFAADILANFPRLDMIINAAGGGYERTLGMYRVSRALLPALRHGGNHNILLNIPPADRHAEDAIFPYASSHQAFQRLCAALAAETRGSAVRVLIGHPATDHVTEVLPDRNAGLVADAYDLTGHANDEKGSLAARVASLIAPAEPFRRAG